MNYSNMGRQVNRCASSAPRLSRFSGSSQERPYSAATYADFLRISPMYLLRLTRLRTAAKASLR
jgi:hypothetical protein